MTIQEVDSGLPNGFHDALLHGYRVDLVEKVAIIDIDVFTGDPEASEDAARERYERGRLTLRAVSFVVIEPQDPAYDAKAPFLIDLCSPRTDQEERFADGSFAGAFFSSSTNSFIRFRAREAEFALEEK